MLQVYDIFSEHQFYSLEYDELQNMLRAIQIRRVGREYEIHLTAWQSVQAQSTETVGTGKKQKQVPIYKNFSEFFDYEQSMKRALGEQVDDVPVEYSPSIDNELINAILKARE